MAKVISAGTFATSGEKRVAEELEKKLPNNWVVICNKTLVANTSRSFEIDLIVIANQWVFLLDEKSWRGRIRGNDTQWVRQDGSAERSPLRKIDMLAKVMAGHLRSNIPAISKETSHFVRGGIVFSASTQPPQISDPLAKENIFLLSNVCESLLKLDKQAGSSLVRQNRHLIQNCLYDLSNRPELPEQVNELYQIEEAMNLRPGVRLWQAKLIDSGEVRNLMVYDLSLDPLHREENRQFYLREFKTLSALQPTGLVPATSDYFPWSEDFVILPIKPLSGKALSAYNPPRSRDELIKEVQVASAVFHGLSVIHEHEVVHRALTPDSIHVIHENQKTRVAFTNFYAARIASQDQSIAVSLDASMIDDPYMAPELVSGYALASSSTDVFSLGLIFLERWSTLSLNESRPDIQHAVAVPNLQERWSTLPAHVMRELTELFQSICAPTQNEPCPSAEEISQYLHDLAKRLKIEVNVEEGKRLDNRYTVSRTLGQGSMARTYLARDEVSDEIFALKQFLNPSSSAVEQAKNEFKVLCKLQHYNLPRVYEVFPPTNDVHVKMGYIPGPTLQEMEKELPWTLEKWWNFAQGLMSAVEELEKYGILHRDIKPANIILHQEDQHPVLIDFGFAIPVDTEKSLAGTPLYLPPEAFTSPKPPISSDRYATAVVLFKTLTGFLPFADNSNGKERILQIPLEVSSPKIYRLAEVLLKALSNNSEERFRSAGELREQLQNIVLAPERRIPDEQKQRPHLQINPWVDDLRSLYRNSQTGNENNRGLDTDFVRKTYVETALDRELLPTLFQALPKVVFLSGNPGDGKTAFLEQVRVHLEELGAEQVFADASGWEWRYKNHIFRSCYDASESNQGQSADEQLTRKLSGLEGDLYPEQSLTVLIAINDGRLVDFFARYRQHFGWLASQISLRNSQQLERDVWLIDLKKRSFVALPESDELAILQDVLQVLLEIDQWQICQECAAKELCPIRQNVQRLNRANISHRLERLFLLAHLRKQRHITMRDLRSAIAYIVTGNLGCADVHQIFEDESKQASLTDYAYWQLVFASEEGTRADSLLSDFTLLDPGRFAHPRLDRFLHFYQGEEYKEKRSLLFRNKIDLSRQRFLSEREWIAAFKRRLYFEMPTEIEGSPSLSKLNWERLLPYNHASTFFDALRGREDLEALKNHLALGLLRSNEGVAGISTKEQLSITVESSEEHQLIVLKQFPLSEFHLQIDQSQRSEGIEFIPEILIFEHHTGTPRLEITLDLFELLMRLSQGLQPGVPEYIPLLEDLKMFKSTLLLQETRDLVLIENKQRVHYITQRNGKIVRSDVPLH